MRTANPLNLEFDRDLCIREWVKTQFAGAWTYLELIALLRVLQQFFEDFKVEDEGGYWETGNEATLADHITPLRRSDCRIATRKSVSSNQKESQMAG